jgi:trimeric autotransporter adhesin
MNAIITRTLSLQKLLTHSLHSIFVLTMLSSLAIWLCHSSFGVTPAPDGDYGNGNTAEGSNALFNLGMGQNNTAIGAVALFHNDIGSRNTAVGSSALVDNTIGNGNTACGYQALFSNTTASENTAAGSNALFKNTTGGANTATGADALISNTTGSFNTATGRDALLTNTTGDNNTATGESALGSNTIGFSNTANGEQALSSNTTGNDNTAVGENALLNNTTGVQNTAVGLEALQNNIKGNNNVALGLLAGANLTTGSNNIEIGANVLGLAGEANTIRLGKQGTQKSTFIAGISGTAVSGSTVVVSSNGKLGVATSSARFKEAIKPMDKSSEAILALNPVNFRYKKEIDPEATPQFGLIAEEVEKVNPDLVGRDENGKVTTVRYEAVNAMLLNEFLKEHRKGEEQSRQIQEQEATIMQLKKEVETVIAYLKEQDSKIQKVSAQVKLTKAAPQVVLNNQ